MAQAVSATLLGSVNDPTGAEVVQAKVTATMKGTGSMHENFTNASGNYTFPTLLPGTYTVTVEAAGFKKATHENVDVLVNSSTPPRPGHGGGSHDRDSAGDHGPALLQTDRADISTKIEARQVADLPLGTNRNFQSLLNLVPGTAPAVFQHSQFFNAQSSLQTEANGFPAWAIFIRSKESTTTSAPACSRSSFPRRRLSSLSIFRPTTSSRAWPRGRRRNERDVEVGHKCLPRICLRIYPEQRRECAVRTSARAAGHLAYNYFAQHRRTGD